MIIAPPEKRHTTFKGDVLRLVSGTGLAQIIALLAAPILTRLYAPEAFGVAAVFGSIISILGVLACMRYELAIVLPDNDREAANLFVVSLGFSVLIAGLTIPLIWFGGQQILKWVNMPELASYLWLIPLMTLIQGVFTALNYWNTRTKHFTRLSIARVTSALAQTSASLGAGLAGHATGGSLITAQVGGQAVATTVLGGQIWRDNGRFIISSVTWREMWSGLKRHRKFPIYGTWAGLLNTISWQLPVLMLGGFFSTAVAGFYALGFRILQMPMSLIGRAISQVFHQRAAEAANTGTLALLVATLFEKLFVVALFPMLMLMIVGKDVYIVLFGEQWAEAGAYTQILAPWALVWFVSSPLSSLFGVLGRQEQGLKINILVFVSRLVSISIGAFMNSAILAIFLFSASGVVVYGYVIAQVFRYAKVQTVSVSTVIVKRIGQTVPFLAASFAVVMLTRDSNITLAAVAGLSGLYFFLNRSDLFFFNVLKFKSKRENT